jgi:hypothetical protein
MKITDVQAIHLRLPEIQQRTDSSQDALLAKVRRRRAVGNPKFRVGDSFTRSPAKASRYSTLQTIGFHAKALNCRRIVGVGNPGPLELRGFEPRAR